MDDDERRRHAATCAAGAQGQIDVIKGRIRQHLAGADGPQTLTDFLKRNNICGEDGQLNQLNIFLTEKLFLQHFTTGLPPAQPALSAPPAQPTLLTLPPLPTLPALPAQPAQPPLPTLPAQPADAAGAISAADAQRIAQRTAEWATAASGRDPVQLADHLCDALVTVDNVMEMRALWLIFYSRPRRIIHPLILMRAGIDEMLRELILDYPTRRLTAAVTMLLLLARAQAVRVIFDLLRARLSPEERLLMEPINFFNTHSAALKKTMMLVDALSVSVRDFVAQRKYGTMIGPATQDTARLPDDVLVAMNFFAAGQSSSAATVLPAIAAAASPIVLDSDGKVVGHAGHFRPNGRHDCGRHSNPPMVDARVQLRSLCANACPGWPSNLCTKPKPSGASAPVALPQDPFALFADRVAARLTQANVTDILPTQ